VAAQQHSGFADSSSAAGVDTNIDNKPGAALRSIRERLAEHRKNPSCNACHASIDPLGFALENYDVIGGWRAKDESGQLWTRAV
jgi:hypothetical protein